MLSLTVADLMHDYNVLSIDQKDMKHFRELRIKKESSYNDDLTVLTKYLNKLCDLHRPLL